MKKIIFGIFLTMATTSYATEYNCTVTYGNEMQTNVPVIKDNSQSKLGTMLQLNASKKFALISIKSASDSNFQDVSVYFANPGADSIGSNDESITTLTASDQKSILLTGRFSGKYGSLSCERE